MTPHNHTQKWVSGKITFEQYEITVTNMAKESFSDKRFKTWKRHLGCCSTDEEKAVFLLQTEEQLKG